MSAIIYSVGLEIGLVITAPTFKHLTMCQAPRKMVNKHLEFKLCKKYKVSIEKRLREGRAIYKGSEPCWFAQD